MQKLSVYSMPSWESAAALFEIHLRLKRVMTTDVSVMLKIKLHVLHIIWHSEHMLISEVSPLDHSAVFWRNKFYDRCHQRCKQLIVLAQLPRHHTSHQQGFSSYVVTTYLILTSQFALLLVKVILSVSPLLWREEKMKNCNWGCLQNLSGSPALGIGVGITCGKWFIQRTWMDEQCETAG